LSVREGGIRTRGFAGERSPARGAYEGTWLPQ
jgi:hypothetical protein